MKNLLLILIAVVVCTLSGFAQDMLNSNDFLFKKEHFNTSYITSDSTSLNISTVVSTANAVQNNSKFHFLLYGNMGKSGIGVGAKVNTSFYNVFQTTTAEFMLAKRVDVGKENVLSFGLNGGVILNSLKLDRINQYTDLQDPVITDGTFNKTGFTTGLGFNYNWKDRIDLGISLPVLVQSNEGVAPVFFTNLSYKHRFNENISIEPGVLVYGPNYTTPTIEGNVRLDYKENLYVKVGGRSTSSFIFGAGASINFIEVGYMYNMVLGDPFNEAYNGQHNINVAFKFLAKNPFEKKEQQLEVSTKGSNE